MKKILAIILSIATLLSIPVAMTSCGNSSDLGAEVAMYFVGDVYDFDPTRAYVDDDAVKLFNLIYEPLFTLNAKGEVEGALAKSYEIIEDEEKGLYQMEIVLRDTYWNTGDPVTAEDVLYAWERILDCGFKSQAAAMLYDIKNALAVKRGDMTISDLGISADNKLLTITFEGKINYDEFLRNLTSIALVPLSNKNSNVDKASDYWGKRKATIITNGPFCIDTLDYNMGELTLQRNVYYRRSPAETKGVTDHVTPNLLMTKWNIETEDVWYTNEQYLDLMYEQFVNKAIFYIGDLSLAKRAECKDIAEVSDLLSTYTCVFGQNNPAFANEKVRLALSAAIDREYIAELLTFAKPATGLISYGVYNGKSAKKSFRTEGGELISATADMDLARQLIKESGLQFNSNTRKITLGYKDCQADEEVAAYIASVWRELGFNVNLRALSTDDVEIKTDPNDDSTKINIKENQYQDAYEALASKDSKCDAILVDYQMFSVNALTALAGFTSSMNGNGIDMTLDEEGYRSYEFISHVCGYKNEEYDALVKKAYEEKDLDKRAEILHEAEKMLLEDMPVIPLVFNQSFYLSSKLLKKIEVNPYGLTALTNLKMKNYKKYLTVEDAE
jgi:ABC-type transport system substrate-binding protein